MNFVKFTIKICSILRKLEFLTGRTEGQSEFFELSKSPLCGVRVMASHKLTRPKYFKPYFRP